MTEKIPKVSVCVVAYNQEKYIGECLQSLVEQETDFDFEVVVGEDCSTDATRAVIREFEEKYPGIVRMIAHERNVGPTRNYLAVQRAARGKYLAHMDGDDCALPGKLQAQADSLDANPDISYCVHAVKVMGTEETIGDDAHLPVRGTIGDLLVHGTYFVNSSVMYRKEYELLHSDEAEIVDYYLHIERASKGAILLDRRVLGCYRIHPQGISKNLKYRSILENCYERAFDRALELGAPYELVQSARLKKRMTFSIARYMSGDVDGYKSKIKIGKEEFDFASAKHRILHWTRFFPGFVGMYARIRGMQ